MKLETLATHFPNANGPHLDHASALFKRLEVIPETFYALIADHNDKYSLEFTSTSCETVTGYPVSRFEFLNGFPFIYSITPQETKALILAQEASYLKKARLPGFNEGEPFLLEMEGAICHRNGTVMKLWLTAMVLRFRPDKQFQLSINVWHTSMQRRNEISSILNEVHRLYIGLHPPLFSTASKDDVIRLSYPSYRWDTLTKKEVQVLKMLADGKASKQIADLLHTSQNTVESHRRHLLDKFQATNVAELIKKATKVYWLE
jgi:DNA-binding CsgD family transcriptional regulator